MSSAMPVAGVTAMLRMTAPSKAAGILMSMPADRIQAVLTAMEPADLGRILATAKPERAVPALCALAPERIALILMAMSVQPAARFLAAMPADLVSSVLVMMPAERAEQLVAVLRPAPAAPPAPQASPAHTPPASTTCQPPRPVARPGNPSMLRGSRNPPPQPGADGGWQPPRRPHRLCWCRSRCGSKTTTGWRTSAGSCRPWARPLPRSCRRARNYVTACS